MPYIIAGGTLAALIMITLTVSYVTYRMTFYRGRVKVCDPYCDLETKTMRPYKEFTRDLIDGLVAEPFERIYVKSHDGLTLAGRYYEASPSAPVMIQMHGYKSTPYRDFAGGFKIVRDMGMNLIHCEQRAHEESEGKTITFGILECEDCLSWIEYVAERFGKERKIILCGISMGASTVLMASGRDLPDSVVGVIADCPYSSPKDIILKVATVDMKLPGELFYPFIYLGARIFGGFKLTADSATEAVKRAKVPILLFHGQSDRFVPHEMSERIYASAKEKITFHSFAEAGHGMCYIVDSERYTKATRDFVSSLKL